MISKYLSAFRARLKTNRYLLGRKMDIIKISKHYQVRQLDKNDLDAVFTLCSQNSLYYEYCPPMVTRESISNDMKALPPKKDLSDKYYLGYFDGGKLIAVLDFIASYPNETTAFIGFFMVDISAQNKGIGSAIIDELCLYLPEAGFTSLRLGWVKGNSQAEHFWHKNGFAENGFSYDTDNYIVVVAQRDL